MKVHTWGRICRLWPQSSWPYSQHGQKQNHSSCQLDSINSYLTCPLQLWLFICVTFPCPLASQLVFFLAINRLKHYFHLCFSITIRTIRHETKWVLHTFQRFPFLKKEVYSSTDWRQLYPSPWNQTTMSQIYGQKDIFLSYFAGIWRKGHRLMFNKINIAFLF